MVSLRELMGTYTRQTCETSSVPGLFWAGGGGGDDKLPKLEARSSLTRRHSKNLSESRIRAVQCYDCPRRRCGSGITRREDKLNLVPANAAGTATHPSVLLEHKINLKAE